VYESPDSLKMARGAQQVRGGDGVAAIVVRGVKGFGYARQMDDGIHAAQRFRKSGSGFQVAMRRFHPGGQVRGRAPHQTPHGTALRR